MTTYNVMLGISVRAYKTVKIEADGLLDLMNKAKDEVERQIGEEGWDVEIFDTACDETLVDAVIEHDDGSEEYVVEDVDLTKSERFAQISAEVEAEL